MAIDTSVLTPKQIQALPLLARGALATEIAAQIDVTVQTVSAWKKDKQFMMAVGALRWEQLYSSITHIQALARVATAGLEKVILEAKDDKARLEACKYVLEVAGINLGREGFGWNIASDAKPPSSI